MKRKPIRIDWDELESAFDNDRKDFVHYLDLVTGEVILDGEGEEVMTAEDEDEVNGPKPVLGEIPARLYVERAGPADERAWMDDFIRDDASLDDVTRARLKQALAQESADVVRDVLRQVEGARERWFVYRADRLHQLIDEWLGENGVVVAEPPPWK